LKMKGDVTMDKKKILIVDDEMDTRLVLEKGLTAEGYSVITAYNGNNALSMIKSECPDLIVLDRVLGDMLGEEVAAKLKKDAGTRDIPIIFLSALFSREDEVEQDHVFGDEKMFAKPYDMEKLLVTIKNILSEGKNISHRSSKGNPPIGMGISVLIIEDEDDVRKVLECSLKSDGFDVYSAADGIGGLKIASEERPDLVLLDWVMPKMNGLEVLSKLKQNERTRDIIIFMLTAKNMTDDLSTALGSGADDYIIKPFDGEELGQRITSMLGAVKELKKDNVCEGEKLVSLSQKQ